MLTCANILLASRVHFESQRNPLLTGRNQLRYLLVYTGSGWPTEYRHEQQSRPQETPIIPREIHLRQCPGGFRRSPYNVPASCTQNNAPRFAIRPLPAENTFLGARPQLFTMRTTSFEHHQAIPHWLSRLISDNDWIFKTFWSRPPPD